jgi:hypothetical protein
MTATCGTTLPLVTRMFLLGLLEGAAVAEERQLSANSLTAYPRTRLKFDRIGDGEQWSCRSSALTLQLRDICGNLDT